MKEQLEIINQQEVLGKSFKIYGDFENPLFLAKDVANWIEHSNTSKMLNSVDDDEKVKRNLGITNSYGQVGHGGVRENTEHWFLTEYGLYEVLMQSRKPIAKQFKKEVKKILKEIRTTGTHTTNPLPVLTPKQRCAITIFDVQATDMDKLLALQEFGEISSQEGQSVICNDSVITIPQIREMVFNRYGDQLNEMGVTISEPFTEFSRYLKYTGYLETSRFERKDGKGLEKLASYQPTQMFEDVFVKQGMALIRKIDDRGKYEIKYTKNIEKFIVTEHFHDTFIKYIDLVSPLMIQENIEE